MVHTGYSPCSWFNIELFLGVWRHITRQRTLSESLQLCQTCSISIKSYSICSRRLIPRVSLNFLMQLCPTYLAIACIKGFGYIWSASTFQWSTCFCSISYLFTYKNHPFMQLYLEGERKKKGGGGIWYVTKRLHPVTYLNFNSHNLPGFKSEEPRFWHDNTTSYPFRFHRFTSSKQQMIMIQPEVLMITNI